jgi:hypothetical protein
VAAFLLSFCEGQEQQDGPCFTTGQIYIPGSGDIQGWINVRKCTCQEARNEGLSLSNSGIVGNFIPVCNGDGTFYELQSWGSVGTSWCVDTATGNQVSLTSFRGNVPLPCEDKKEKEKDKEDKEDKEKKIKP